MFFKHFSCKNQLPGFYIGGALIENGLSNSVYFQCINEQRPIKKFIGFNIYLAPPSHRQRRNVDRVLFKGAVLQIQFTDEVSITCAWLFLSRVACLTIEHVCHCPNVRKARCLWKLFIKTWATFSHFLSSFLFVN